MASRQAESMALVKRCEKAGFTTVTAGTGIKVFTPDGPYVIHMSYSDSRSLLNATKMLEKKGLTAAEAAMAAIKETKRVTTRANTKAAQAATFSNAEDDQRNTEEAAREAALRRAAGPYTTPEDVKITWYAQPHPKPWMRWVLMTPEIADYLLREHNTKNRPERPGRVEYYKRIMAKNKWRLTHQGAAMDSNAVLQDGQHRLRAIVEAGKIRPDIKVAMPFFVGMDPENFAAIDENLNRSPMDLFARGGIKYGPAITTLVRLALAYRQDEPRRLMREKQPNETILEFFEENDPDLLQDCAKFGVTHWKKTMTTAGPLAAARYLLLTSNNVGGHHNVYVEAYLEGLVHGRKAGTRLVLDDDDPRKVVRNFFFRVKEEKRKFTPLDAVSVIIIGWNNVVLGNRPQYMRYNPEADTPRIVRCADRGPDQSACPSALRGEIGVAE